MILSWLDWPAPKKVKACFTERQGGCSLPPFDSFNLALHVDDKKDLVLKNRQVLAELTKQGHVHWLEQVHSTRVVDIGQPYTVKADASFSKQTGQVCCVMTADCLPIFFCDRAGQQVAVAHAGWRGLCGGVLHNTANAFAATQTLMAYLGPAISQSAFEVGGEVRSAFIAQYPHLNMEKHFVARRSDNAILDNKDPVNKWMGDLYGIAKDMLKDLGVHDIYGGNRCTFTEERAFFSFRREGKTGRMANLIWLE
ncbi:MAG: YfiH family protein [Cellvibrionaceae bacterium]|jgi:YfiH family protein